MAATRPLVGISSLSGGAEYFRDCIRWYLDEDVDPFDLHEMSILEVERIRRKMNLVSCSFKYSYFIFEIAECVTPFCYVSSCGKIHPLRDTPPYLKAFYVKTVVLMNHFMVSKRTPAILDMCLLILRSYLWASAEQI